MAQLNFNAQNVEPRKAFEPVPGGWYSGFISASESKPTSAGDGSYLMLELTISEGPYQGRKLFDRLNLNNKNPVAVEIAYATLSAICHATGVIQVQDSVQLHNIPLDFKASVRPADGQYEASNDVKGYKAYGTGGKDNTPASQQGFANGGGNAPQAGFNPAVGSGMAPAGGFNPNAGFNPGGGNPNFQNPNAGTAMAQGGFTQPQNSAPAVAHNPVAHNPNGGYQQPQNQQPQYQQPQNAQPQYQQPDQGGAPQGFQQNNFAPSAAHPMNSSTPAGTNAQSPNPGFAQPQQNFQQPTANGGNPNSNGMATGNPVGGPAPSAGANPASPPWGQQFGQPNQ